MSPREAETYRQIWIGVLLQAMRDIFRPRIAIRRRPTGVERHDHGTAIAWLGSRDFHQVCALAGLDGTKVEAGVRRRLSGAANGCADVPEALFNLGGASQHRRGRTGKAA